MIFFVLSVVVGLVVAVVFLEPKYQMLAVRVVYLLIVCLLPGLLFFLFIATRKWSLLSEFLTNMDRLGFYRPGSSESDDLELARRRRVDAYLQKLEALYVLAGGEVAAAGLATRIRQAATLVFATRSGSLCGVAALKRPTLSYRRGVTKCRGPWVPTGSGVTQ